MSIGTPQVTAPAANPVIIQAPQNIATWLASVPGGAPGAPTVAVRDVAVLPAILRF